MSNATIALKDDDDDDDDNDVKLLKLSSTTWVFFDFILYALRGTSSTVLKRL